MHPNSSHQGMDGGNALPIEIAFPRHPMAVARTCPANEISSLSWLSLQVVGSKQSPSTTRTSLVQLSAELSNGTTLPPTWHIPCADNATRNVVPPPCNTSGITLLLLHVESVTRSTITICPPYPSRNRQAERIGRTHIYTLEKSASKPFADFSL